MKWALAVFFIYLICHNVSVSASKTTDKSVSRKSTYTSTLSPTSTKTAIPNFTIEDFSRYVDSKGEKDTIVMDISEAVTQTYLNDTLIDYYDDNYYYTDNVNEVNTSQRPNDKTESNKTAVDSSSQRPKEKSGSHKNVERDAYVPEGNYAYYSPAKHPSGDWHPVPPPPHVVTPHPILLTQPSQRLPPPIIVHPAPTTTEDSTSNILHYTINYQV